MAALGHRANNGTVAAISASGRSWSTNGARSTASKVEVPQSGSSGRAELQKSSRSGRGLIWWFGGVGMVLFFFLELKKRFGHPWLDGSGE